MKKEVHKFIENNGEYLPILTRFWEIYEGSQNDETKIKNIKSKFYNDLNYRAESFYKPIVKMINIRKLSGE